MNKIITLLAVLLYMTLYGCKRQDIPTYDDLTSDRYVFFYRAETDSAETSFFFYPGEDEIEFKVKVRATGAGLVDEPYVISVVQEETTAPSDSYELPVNPIMRAGLAYDSCYVTLKKTDLLNTTKVRLVLELKDSEHFLLGRTEYRRNILWFHNIIAKPAWWNADCIKLYLGNYSDKKYQLYLDVVGVDLTDATSSEFRNYALIFKQYLKNEKYAGRTVYEDDGSEMVVAVLGNLT